MFWGIESASVTWKLKLFVVWGQNARFQPKRHHLVTTEPLCDATSQSQSQSFWGSHRGGDGQQPLVSDQYRVWESNICERLVMASSHLVSAMAAFDTSLYYCYNVSCHPGKNHSGRPKELQHSFTSLYKYEHPLLTFHLPLDKGTPPPVYSVNCAINPRKHWLHPVSDFSIIFTLHCLCSNSMVGLTAWIHVQPIIIVPIILGFTNCLWFTLQDFNLFNLQSNPLLHMKL